MQAVGFLLRHLSDSGVMVDRGKLYRQAVWVRKIDPIRATRAVWIQPLALQLFHHCIGPEVLDSDAVMVQPWIRVLEERQEIFAQPEKTVALRLVEDGHAKVLLVKVS
jgi:hypothetical protein